MPISIINRSVCISSKLQKKKAATTQEEVLVNKTNQRAHTNKKSFLEKKIKQKKSVLGIIDVYRFITVQCLATLVNKSIGDFSLWFFSIIRCKHFIGIILFSL